MTPDDARRRLIDALACPVCEQPMPALNRHGKPRKVCSQTCAARNAAAQGRLIDLDEVLHLTDCGESPYAITTRLGHPDSIARALARHGRSDLARPFWNIRSAQRWAERQNVPAKPIQFRAGRDGTAESTNRESRPHRGAQRLTQATNEARHKEAS